MCLKLAVQSVIGHKQLGAQPDRPCGAEGHSGVCDVMGSAIGPAKAPGLTRPSCQVKQPFSSLKVRGRDRRGSWGRLATQEGASGSFVPQTGVTAVPLTLLQRHHQPSHSSESWNGEAGSRDTGLFSCPQQFAAVDTHQLQLHAFRGFCIGKGLNRDWLTLWQQMRCQGQRIGKLDLKRDEILLCLDSGCQYLVWF